MSRVRRREITSTYRFPRVSGDEPRAALIKAAAALFSPRERG